MAWRSVLRAMFLAYNMLYCRAPVDGSALKENNVSSNYRGQDGYRDSLGYYGKTVQPFTLTSASAFRQSFAVPQSSKLWMWNLPAQVQVKRKETDLYASSRLTLRNWRYHQHDRTNQQRRRTLGLKLKKVSNQTEITGSSRICHPGPPKEPSPRFKNCLIIGDSISLGYSSVVSSLLSGMCQVQHAPFSRGSGAMDSRYGLQCLPMMLRTTDLRRTYYDAIVFNFGLHDINYSGQFPEEYVPLQEYKKNLQKIKSHLLSTGTNIAFVLTTPVPSDVVVNSKVLLYNQVAKSVMLSGKPVGVIDLYTAIIDNCGQPPYPYCSLMRRPKDVHYNLRGYRILGDRVAAGFKTLLAQEDAQFWGRSQAYNQQDQAPWEYKSFYCPDKITRCPFGSTCCLSRFSLTGYGCCMFPDAVPCADRWHCCQKGFHCSNSCTATKCTCLSNNIVQNSSINDKSFPNKQPHVNTSHFKEMLEASSTKGRHTAGSSSSLAKIAKNGENDVILHHASVLFKIQDNKHISGSRQNCLKTRKGEKSLPCELSERQTMKELLSIIQARHRHKVTKEVLKQEVLRLYNSIYNIRHGGNSLAAGSSIAALLNRIRNRIKTRAKTKKKLLNRHKSKTEASESLLSTRRRKKTKQNGHMTKSKKEKYMRKKGSKSLTLLHSETNKVSLPKKPKSLANIDLTLTHSETNKVSSLKKAKNLANIKSKNFSKSTKIHHSVKHPRKSNKERNNPKQQMKKPKKKKIPAENISYIVPKTGRTQDKPKAVRVSRNNTISSLEKPNHKHLINKEAVTNASCGTTMLPNKPSMKTKKTAKTSEHRVSGNQIANPGSKVCDEAKIMPSVNKPRQRNVHGIVVNGSKGLKNKNSYPKHYKEKHASTVLSIKEHVQNSDNEATGDNEVQQISAIGTYSFSLVPNGTKNPATKDEPVETSVISGDKSGDQMISKDAKIKHLSENSDYNWNKTENKILEFSGSTEERSETFDKNQDKESEKIGTRESKINELLAESLFEGEDTSGQKSIRNFSYAGYNNVSYKKSKSRKSPVKFRNNSTSVIFGEGPVPEQEKEFPKSSSNAQTGSGSANYFDNTFTENHKLMESGDVDNSIDKALMADELSADKPFSDVKSSTDNRKGISSIILNGSPNIPNLESSKYATILENGVVDFKQNTKGNSSWTMLKNHKIGKLLTPQSHPPSYSEDSINEDSGSSGINFIGNQSSKDMFIEIPKSTSNDQRANESDVKVSEKKFNTAVMKPKTKFLLSEEHGDRPVNFTQNLSQSSNEDDGSSFFKINSGDIEESDNILVRMDQSQKSNQHSNVKNSLVNHKRKKKTHLTRGRISQESGDFLDSSASSEGIIQQPIQRYGDISSSEGIIQQPIQRYGDISGESELDFTPEDGDIMQFASMNNVDNVRSKNTLEKADNELQSTASSPQEGWELDPNPTYYDPFF